ncbi:MAG TPA: UDP-2,4-diacetamido-2,4,6-trideoxy-beta-L-altropyranose hydrolase [Blastocatellia bacterium]|nr:UDP-2,4-diacetamido-2,4,6-trideoxy-beta-L-altropyranose hydrolase [Blastocatellia bacterium]
MNTLLIRADATGKIGAGHVMRCLALAEAWQANGGRVTLLSHCENPRLEKRIESCGFAFRRVTAPHPAASDVRETIELIETLRPAWVALDGYQFDTDYQRAIRGADVSLLVVDDFAHLSHYHADIVLNQNIDAADLPYKCDPDTELLLGPRYSLLRREFLSRGDRDRSIPQVATKILVTLGGADAGNATLQVVEALKQVRVQGFTARIVAGPFNPHFDLLCEAVRTRGRDFEVLSDVADMADQMAWADLTISAAGSTCWELAFMGSPSILMVTANNQCGIAAGLDKAGAAISLGWFDMLPSKELSDKLAELMLNQALRQEMSRLSKELVDGRGAQRIVNALQVAKTERNKSAEYVQVG